jgi:hypothetical protein
MHAVLPHRDYLGRSDVLVMEVLLYFLAWAPATGAAEGSQNKDTKRRKVTPHRAQTNIPYLVGVTGPPPNAADLPGGGSSWEGHLTSSIHGSKALVVQGE